MKKELKKTIALFQANEITEYLIYKSLSKNVKGKNKKVLQLIAQDELKHYNAWKKYTDIDVKPKKLKIIFYLILSKIMGLTFVMKMLENGEEDAEDIYLHVIKYLPETKEIIEDEIKHEKLLVNMINEEKIGYISSMVLGVNDALVEITGMLAGLTFALKNTSLIGLAGIITGIAASLSMGVSEYLSQEAENQNKKNDKSPIKAALYTSIAYISTVILLVSPYFIFKNYLFAFLLTVSNALVVVLIFTFFMSVVRTVPFKKIFLKMLVLSTGVSLLSFLIGLVAKKILGG